MDVRINGKSNLRVYNLSNDEKIKRTIFSITIWSLTIYFLFSRQQKRKVVEEKRSDHKSDRRL